MGDGPTIGIATLRLTADPDGRFVAEQSWDFPAELLAGAADELRVMATQMDLDVAAAALQTAGRHPAGRSER